MRRGVALAIMFACTSAAPAAPLEPAALEALRAIDLRLATIAHRLVTANAALCDRTMPATGLVLHAIDQFDAETQRAARAVFGFAAPVAVEAVVGESAAARAGVVANDGVLAVGDVDVPAPRATQGSATRDAVLTAIEAQPGPVQIATTRGPRTIAAPRGCAARFEVLLGPEMTAQADASVVQIGVRFFERYRDDETAVIVAHELAHIVLRHRARLEAAGVKGRLLAEFGRNGRLNRRVEDEADLLGLHLLRNAGYDPASAPRFWRAHGGDIDGGLFRSRTHASSGDRATALEVEIAAIPAGAGVPYRPAVLATRGAGLK